MKLMTAATAGKGWRRSGRESRADGFVVAVPNGSDSDSVKNVGNVCRRRNSVSMMRYPVIFLPGIIAPAAIRYGPLVERLGDVDVVVRDLAVYDNDEPPPDFTIDTELGALDRAADDAGFTKFHLYGHSGGGAVALAYAASH